jgi:hypothetical protein
MGLVETWITDPDGVQIVLVEVPEDHHCAKIRGEWVTASPWSRSLTREARAPATPSRTKQCVAGPTRDQGVRAALETMPAETLSVVVNAVPLPGDLPSLIAPRGRQRGGWMREMRNPVALV